MNTTRRRTVGTANGTDYALIQYIQNVKGTCDYTLANCDPDGSNERHHHFVPPKVYCARAPAGIKRAPTPVPHNVFVKYPAVQVHFETPQFAALKRRALREVRFCELLRMNPHPNVAQYHGCIVVDGYIRGICFARLATTLHDAVDPLPGCAFKEQFRYGAHPLPKGRAHLLATLRAGVEHVHSLGYVHNDVKPDSVMLKADGAAVVIDFDSVLRRGEATWPVPKTPGWYHPLRETAEPENDWDAVHDVEEWLSDKQEKEFRLPSEEACRRMLNGE